LASESSDDSGEEPEKPSGTGESDVIEGDHEEEQFQRKLTSTEICQGDLRDSWQKILLYVYPSAALTDNLVDFPPYHQVVILEEIVLSFLDHGVEFNPKQGRACRDLTNRLKELTADRAHVNKGGNWVRAMPYLYYSHGDGSLELQALHNLGGQSKEIKAMTGCFASVSKATLSKMRASKAARHEPAGASACAAASDPLSKVRANKATRHEPAGASAGAPGAGAVGFARGKGAHGTNPQRRGTVPCRDGVACTRRNCWFGHPERNGAQ
jgi:hypothetical protein